MNNKIRLRWEKVQTPALRPCRRTAHWRFGPGSIVCLAALLVSGLGYWCWDCATLQTHAKRGDAVAQYRLGKQKLESAKTAADFANAVEWIREAAERGNMKAETALGQLYTKGLGMGRDYAEANKWLNRAAEQGSAVAENELGIMYAKGMGVPQNFEQASLWCGKAAAQGSTIAKHNLALVQLAKRTTLTTLTTSDGRLHKNATLQSISADGITVTLQPQPGSVVLAKLKVESLTGRIKEVCGYTAKGGTNSPFSQLDSITVRL